MSDTDKRKEFNDALAQLVELANVSGNRLTSEQIKLYFKDIIDNEEGYGFIYNYLTELKIDIEGIEGGTSEVKADEKSDIKKTEEALPSDEKTEIFGKQETEEAKSFYNMYINELEGISSEDNSREELLKGHLKGETDCTKALVESYLKDVIRLSDEYANSPLGKSDLVAEGNLALYEAVIEYCGSEIIEEFEKNILDRVRKSMEKAVYEEIGSGRISSHLVERINKLNDTSTELAKDLGREATLAELSERLAYSEDEIKELMKISINALTIDESGE